MLSKKVLDVFELYNGTLSLKLAKEHGIDYETLRKAYLRGDIEKVARGVYNLPDRLVDDFLATQAVYSKGIYSHETALILYGYGTFTPFKYKMTFPKGYHSENFSNNLIEPYFTRKEFYELGLTKVKSWFGNEVLAYDKERTILDMLSSRKALVAVVEEALDDYFYDDDKNLDRLEEYAHIMGLQNKLKEVIKQIA